MSVQSNNSQNSRIHRLQAELANLLQLHRDPEAERMVHKVLTSSSKLEEKIQQIKVLDQDTNHREEVKKNPGEEDPSPLISDEAEGKNDPSASLMEVEKNRRHQKVLLNPVGFFTFLFKEMGSIVKFGAETFTIDTGFFPFQIFLNKNIPKNFEERFKKQTVKPLDEYLSHFLRKAWIHLTKKEFNLLVLLKKLCETLLEIPFGAFNVKNRRLIDRLKGVENLFFVFYSDKDYMHLTEKALEVLESKVIFPGKNRPQLLSLGRRLLAKDVTKPSLYNLIRALNMLRYHRFFELEDLFFSDMPPLLSDDDFDTSPDVLQEILTHIADLEKSLKPLIANHKEILAIQNFMPASYNGDVDFSPLEALYSMSVKDDKPANLFMDKNNLISMFINLLQQFNERVVPIIHGQIRAMDGRYVELFDQSFYGNIVSRIQYNLAKIEKIHVIMPTFSFERYHTLINTRRGAIPNEAAVLECVDNVLGDFFALGQSLMDVLLQRMACSPGAESLKPISTIAFQKRTYFLPMEFSQMDGQGIFYKRTPPELLTTVVQICFLTCWLMEHQEIQSKVQSKERVSHKTKAILETIRRLANRGHYHKILKEVQP